MWHKIKHKYYLWLWRHRQFDFFGYLDTSRPFMEYEIDVRRDDKEMFKSHFHVDGKKFVMIADRRIDSYNVRVYPINNVDDDTLKNVFNGILTSININNKSNHPIRYNFRLYGKQYAMMKRLFKRNFGHLEFGRVRVI